MIHKDVLPNAYVYNSIVGAYIESGAIEQAFVLAEKMKNSGVSANIVTYNLVLLRILELELSFSLMNIIESPS